MKTMKTSERDGMAKDADKQCEESGAGDRIIRIPAIRRYQIDYRWSAIKPVDGPWVRYDDHVTAMESMRSEIGRLEEQIAELNKNLMDAKLEAKDFQNMLRGFK